MNKAEGLSKQYRDFREQCGIKDPVILDEIEEAYFEGYLKAEKDTIEKTAKWLKNNLEGVVGGSIYIEDFLKAMKDE